MAAEKYPPCFKCDCSGDDCRRPGETVPYEWPELIGVEIMKAKVTIENTNPNVTAVPMADCECIHTSQLCCNRVWLCPDKKGLVRLKPIVG
ncbi:hypothetical protein MTR67_037157 [Solanum verrucosum]|uniref:Serine protease inhibitor, potato inhibitor I-type family protein n=1 Tax=Solanum verrucosum TaxID=315347 RepID=A0AAF0ZLR6_SOLVR|nr:hypothetical protein MTR67_037157 [Solanum verrucosum]